MVEYYVRVQKVTLGNFCLQCSIELYHRFGIIQVMHDCSKERMSRFIKCS